MDLHYKLDIYTWSAMKDSFGEQLHQIIPNVESGSLINFDWVWFAVFSIMNDHLREFEL